MSRQRKGRARARSAAALGVRALRCEHLEDRRLLAVLTVDTVADTIDFADGKTSLREAITTANSTQGLDEIRFEPTLFLNGARTITLTQGELRIADSLSISGPGAQLLTIDASGSDPTPSLKNADGSRLFSVNDSKFSVLSAFTLRSVKLTGGDSAGAGGAIANQEKLVVENCVIQSNAAKSNGGAIANNISASAMIVGCQILDNHAGTAGGGLSHSSANGLIIERSTIARNSAGVAGTQPPPETVFRGGGISASTFSSLGAIEVRESVIADNSSAGGGGGISGNGLRITSSTISGNSAVGPGGGVYTTSNITILHTLVSQNTSAANGGGVAAIGDSVRVDMTNSTVDGNRSSQFGGGVFSQSAALNIVLATSHSTFSQNQASGQGGGVFVTRGVAQLSHVIAATNSSGFSAFAPDLGGFLGAKYESQYSLIGTNAGSGVAMASVEAPDVNGNIIGGSESWNTINPRLGLLRDNGGPTMTRELLYDSPALNSGNPLLRSGSNGTPSADQRGGSFSRVAAGRIDMGAYERPGRLNSVIVVDSLVDENDGDYSHGDLSLREAIELANGPGERPKITFLPSLIANGPGIIVLTRGELAISAPMTLQGPGHEHLTIDASGNDATADRDEGNGSRVFNVARNFDYFGGPTIEVTISGLSLTGGDTSTSGGAISNRELLSVENCQLYENSAIYNGGGIASSGVLSIRESIIRQNSCGDDGGAVSQFQEALEIVDSYISGNQAGESGGGVYCRCPSTLIQRSVFAGNTAGRDGGGIWRSDGEFLGENSTFSDNTANYDGGGIYNNYGPMTLTQVTVSGNIAGGGGGGLYIDWGCELQWCTITGNRSGFQTPLNAGGGGIKFERVGSATLVSSIVSGNIDASGAAPDIDNLRSAYSFSQLTARNTLVGYNASSWLPEAPLGSPDANGNLIGGRLHGAIDPLLGPLADNGGPTPTHALLTGSPAIDAGDPALVAGAAGTPEFDQRGAAYTRVAGERVDMGAFEAQAASGALGADFNLDGQVDGDDLLVWQRGVGKTGVVTLRHGDATGDGDVDGNDLAVWRARFGVGGDAEVVLAASARAEEQGGGSGARDAAFGNSSLVWLASGGSPGGELAVSQRPMFRPRLRW